MASKTKTRLIVFYASIVLLLASGIVGVAYAWAANPYAYPFAFTLIAIGLSMSLIALFMESKPRDPQDERVKEELTRLLKK